LSAEQSITYDLVVAGHICLDIIPSIPDTGARRVEELFLPGKLVVVGPCALSTGGPVSNTGIGAVKLGCRVAFMAKVGADAFGEMARSLLEESGSSAGVVTDPDAGTAYTVALAPPGIDRIFLHAPGANDRFGSDDVDYALVSRARLFHLGYPPLMRRLYADDGAELAEVFRRAKATGATTSLDMALPDPNSPSGQAPWARILERVLPHVDIFLPSMEEAFFMMHPQEFLARKQAQGGAELLNHISEAECSEMAGTFLAMGAGMSALKSGHRGYYFRTGSAKRLADAGRAMPDDLAGWADRELWCPAFAIERIASATGSGDSSIAGFLTCLLRGGTLHQCLKAANCAGHQNLHALDAVSGLRSWEETRKMLDPELPIIDPAITDEAWRADAGRKLWIGPHDQSQAE
jgi:sugar/nucleoside kinase (ribokinase family)